MPSEIPINRASRSAQFYSGRVFTDHNDEKVRKAEVIEVRVLPAKNITSSIDLFGCHVCHHARRTRTLLIGIKVPDDPDHVRVIVPQFAIDAATHKISATRTNQLGDDLHPIIHIERGVSGPD